MHSKPLGANRPRPPPAVGGDTTDIYENIDVKDINSKLSRLQDLLKKAKNSDSLFNDYVAVITANCEKSMIFPSKLEKINEEKLSIPTVDNLSLIHI